MGKLAGMDKLLQYLNSLSKTARAAFCDACGTSEGYLRKAVSAKQLLAVPTCVRIENETGGRVGRKDLRPDDWEANWPELALKSPPKITARRMPSAASLK